MNEPRYCDYELPTKPFQFCKSVATVRIECNGCYCARHARRIMESLKRSGITRYAEKIARRKP